MSCPEQSLPCLTTQLRNLWHYADGAVNAGPHLGAQFAQLVKELRSEYAAAVTACAERIAGALFQRPGYSINASLHRHGVTGTPTIMQQQVRPAVVLQDAHI